MNNKEFDYSKVDWGAVWLTFLTAILPGALILGIALLRNN